MSRTVMVHINVTVGDVDPRNAEEVGDFILAALEVGLEGAPGSLASGDELSIGDLSVSVTLVDEI
jgi:hypothetical protein